MVARDAKEYPETISSEIQGGRPLHFLRVLSWVPLLEYGTMYYSHSEIMIHSEIDSLRLPTPPLALNSESARPPGT